MKKFISLVLVFLLLLPASVVSANSKLYPDPSIDVFLHGERLVFDIDPIQTQGTTFVQFTTIFKALGLNYEWIAATKEVHGYNATTDIWLTLNDNYAVLDGEFVELPVAPFAYEGRTLVPLRFVSQATGLKVDWDGVNRIINIYGAGSSAVSNPAQRTVDVSGLMLGMEEGDTPDLVQAYLRPDVPAEVTTTTIKYELMDLFGYDTQVYFDFIDKSLTGISYYYGRYGEESILSDYYDILDTLELMYGAAHSYGIYETWEEGVPQVEVDKAISGQLLSYGIENGDYEILASWEFANVYISANLYQTYEDGPNVDVSVSFK